MLRKNHTVLTLDKDDIEELCHSIKKEKCRRSLFQGSIRTSTKIEDNPRSYEVGDIQINENSLRGENGSDPTLPQSWNKDFNNIDANEN